MPLIQWTAASSRWTAARDLFWATNNVFSPSFLFFFCWAFEIFFYGPYGSRFKKKNNIEKDCTQVPPKDFWASHSPLVSIICGVLLSKRWLLIVKSGLHTHLNPARMHRQLPKGVAIWNSIEVNFSWHLCTWNKASICFCYAICCTTQLVVHEENHMTSYLSISDVWDWDPESLPKHLTASVDLHSSRWHAIWTQSLTAG